MEIVLIKDAIKEEKEKIAELDKELLKRGVNLEVKGEDLSVGSREKQVSDSCVEDEQSRKDSRTEDTTSTIPN